MSTFHFEYQKKPDDVKMRLEDWRRIARYLVPEWRPTLQLLFCIVAAAVLVVIPGLLTREVIDTAIPGHDFPRLCLLVAGMILAPLAASLLGVWQSYIATRLGQDVMFDIRNQMYDRLLRQSLRFYTNTRSAEALSRLQSDVGGIQSVVSGTVVNLASNVLTVVATAVVIFHLDWRLALVALAILPIFILPTRKVGRARGQIAGRAQEGIADFSSYVQERLSIGGFLLMRLFGAQDVERATFRRKAGAMRDLAIEQSSLGRWFLMFLMSFASIGPALIYLVGGWEAISGAITTGTVVAFVTFLGRLYAPASALVNAQVDLISATALFRRIFGYLDLPVEVDEPLVPVAIADACGALCFKSVSLAYDSAAARFALDDISFEVPAGKMVALVGPSGAGKTSVTYLATRLYDPTAGSITFDGVDLRAIDLKTLARWTASVTQEAIFFNATVKDSLLYAKPDATDEEIESACQLAQVHEVIAALPEGLMTFIGEKGYKLSGGERQRLALARIALRDPKLIILDEATSSLDSRSEAQISDALKILLQGRSSLVIAHRLSTIIRADLILVMDNGRIVDRGTHAELLSRQGLYEKLYREQFMTHASVE
ncbi:ABC transporter ATP-binding protein [Pseudolysobacter antarcticus]|uniref:ABC transporter ATP-binding protein n=1 Tax=Pseudolysobacter antarcticus TaxID=2511995 RepID=A0A411HNB7_9GAMM|nr:ABC transporter ATP-binding protein [Pseudolysobacter antarcticus]QBB71970.1 ABC transporter ATP-binding protein [Pseudolysobacter antarcticus]